MSQLDESGREHPIYYASRSLNEAEKNYSTFEREGLAIVFSLKKFRHYLLCQKFKLFTDHEALKYVISNRDPQGRIARWISIFSEHNFEVVFRPGPRNVNADYLSRPAAREKLVLTMELEPDLNSVAEYLSGGAIDRASSCVARAVKIRAKNYHMHDGDLFRRTAKGFRFVPGERVRTSIMRGLHDEIGHWSCATTYKIISDRFWWPKIRVAVAHFVRSCDSSQEVNPPEQNEPYGTIPVSGLFHNWLIDFAGPLEDTAAGNKYILFAVENLSSRPVASAIGTNYFNSSGVIKFVEDQICQLYWNLIRILVASKDRDWDDCLGGILGGYRRRPGTDGKSPFEILFGI